MKYLMILLVLRVASGIIVRDEYDYEKQHISQEKDYDTSTLSSDEENEQERRFHNKRRRRPCHTAFGGFDVNCLQAFPGAGHLTQHGYGYHHAHNHHGHQGGGHLDIYGQPVFVADPGLHGFAPVTHPKKQWHAGFHVAADDLVGNLHNAPLHPGLLQSLRQMNPRKVIRQFNREVNRILRPFYRSQMDNGSYHTTDPAFTVELGETKKVESNKDAIAKVAHPTTCVDTLLHIFKANIGSGLLAMGDAYKNGGIIFSPIMTVVLGVISVHAQHILLNASDELSTNLCTKEPPDFAKTVELSFANGPERIRKYAKFMRCLVDLFLCVTQLGFCCVYFVFISNNMKMLMDHFGIYLDLSLHLVIVLIPILLSSLVRNLKYLTPFSSIANLLMIVGLALVVYEATRDLPPVSSRSYIGSWNSLPLFLGTAIYAFEGIGLVLPLKNEMAHPELFQKPFGVLNMGMTIVGSTFIVVGFLGYLKYGNDVQGSLSLNMPAGNVKSLIVQVSIALAILLSYPLQFYVPVDILWPKILKKYSCISHPVFAELAFRSLLVFVTFILAESIPHLALFISLVGAVSSTALALIFPPLIEIVLRSQDKEGCKFYTVIKCAIIIMLGFFIFFTGTYESIKSIVKAFQGGEKFD